MISNKSSGVKVKYFHKYPRETVSSYDSSLLNYVDLDTLAVTDCTSLL